jgi:hypothetical protein
MRGATAASLSPRERARKEEAEGSEMRVGSETTPHKPRNRQRELARTFELLRTGDENGARIGRVGCPGEECNHDGGGRTGFHRAPERIEVILANDATGRH